MTEQTIDTFVQKRIRQIFTEVAEMVGAGQVPELSEDEAAGVPLGLYSAERALLAAWEQVVESEPDEDGVLVERMGQVLWNLTNEFNTSDEFELIKYLDDQRSGLREWLAMAHEERDALRDECDASAYVLDYLLNTAEAARRSLALGRTTGREREAAKARLNAENLLYEAIQSVKDGSYRSEIDTLRQAYDTALADVERAAGVIEQVRSELAVARQEAEVTGEIVYGLGSMLANAIRFSRAWKVSAREWRRTAREAAQAKTWRDVDVVELVEAAGEARRVLDMFKRVLLGPQPKSVDGWHIQQLRPTLKRLGDALRPFVVLRVPIVGTVEDDEELENRVAWGRISESASQRHETTG